MASTGNSNLILNTGIPAIADACIVIVKTEWNSAIVDELEAGCRRVLVQQGARCLETVVVPGAFEIPFGIKSFWDARKYTKERPCSFVALGSVIRGDTPHFEYVCRAVTDGILQLNLLLPVPSIFGVLTVDNEEQALERLGGRHGHKGEEAGITALKMIQTSRNFKP